MPAIPFPASSSPGLKPQESGGRLINGFAEKSPQGARFPLIWRRSPGLREVLDIPGHSHLRGAVLVDSTLVVALDERAYAITESGGVLSATDLGALSGTGAITVARNNATTPDIVAVTDSGAVSLFTGSAPVAYPDSDVGSPNSVTEHNGYFIFGYGDGKLRSSELNSTSILTTDFTTAQSRPDGVLRPVSFRGEMFAFGHNSCEVYRDVGASTFPLEFVTMIPRGLIGTHAVAGWEEGWSNELIWAGEDNRVYQLVGYDPVPVSTADVERSIAAASDRAAVEAMVYAIEGHSFWSLTSPGEWTWEYNLATGEWNERKSDGRDDWRASVSIRAFDQWLIGDRTTGLLFRADESFYREANDPLVWTVESGVPQSFPMRGTIPRAEFDMTAAVGRAAGEDPIQKAPRVAISWANDGGYRWSNPVLREIGAEGDADQRVIVNRTGRFGPKGRRWRLSVSDPVHVAMMGGTMAVQGLSG